ncbi:MAG: choice-of-anchor P family protein, partial [Anaerolineales bacterium]
AKALLSVGPVLGVSAGVLVAHTEDTKAPVTAEGFVVGAKILNVVSAEVLEAEARVKSVSGVCQLSGSSSVTSALVSGLPLALVVDHHLHVPIPLVGTLHLNETLGGPNPTSGAADPSRITQRALWLQVDPLFHTLLGLKEVVAGEAIADFEGGNPCGGPPPSPVDKRRMTGGGKFTGGTTVTHGFVLHCDASRTPNNLQVNWGGGNKFHLESLTSASCSDEPVIEEAPPEAGFDTYKGTGSGRFNGVSGATAEWTFTDAGEPGKNNDSASIVIMDKNGMTVLDVQSTLFTGNHQAHGN